MQSPDRMSYSQALAPVALGFDASASPGNRKRRCVTKPVAARLTLAPSRAVGRVLGNLPSPPIRSDLPQCHCCGGARTSVYVAQCWCRPQHARSQTRSSPVRNETLSACALAVRRESFVFGRLRSICPKERPFRDSNWGAYGCQSKVLTPQPLGIGHNLKGAVLWESSLI